MMRTGRRTMTGVLFRASLRRRWASTLGLVLLVGLAFGVTTATALGARRTATAFPRMVDQLAVPDLSVYVGSTGERVVDAIRNQPGVAVAGVGTGVGLLPRLEDGVPDFEHALGALVGDGTVGRQIDRPLLLAGRLPADDAPLEVMLDERAASQLGAGVGDVVAGLAFDVDAIQQRSAEFERSGREPTAADLAEVFTPVDLDVVGIGRSTDTILVNEAVAEDASVLLSPAFLERFPNVASYTIAAVDLRTTAASGDYLSALRGALPGVDLSGSDQAVRRASFAAAVRPYWLMLALFAAVSGVASLLAVGPAVLRIVDEELADQYALAALGATRRSLVRFAVLRPVVVSATGAVVGAVIAVGASGRFPIGPARAAEPHIGPDVHVVGLVTGGLALVALTAVAAGGRAVVLTRRGVQRRHRPSGLVSAAAGAGLGPAALCGLHAAVAPGPARQRRRLATAGLAGATVAAVGALGFGAGLGRLVGEPARYGWNWDVLFENYDTPLDDELVQSLRSDPDVLGLVPLSRGTITLAGTPVPAIGLDMNDTSGVGPTVLEGRAPAAAGEIALGTVTARQLGVHVGDTLHSTTASGSALPLEVVGTVVVPSIQLDTSNELGQGSFLSRQDYDRLAGWFPTAALANVRDGVSNDELEARLFVSALGVQRPGDVASYDGVAGVPGLLAAVLAALALVVLVHLLLGAVGERRRELAVLRSLGFRPRQLAATVLWQASAQVLAVLVVAVPLGVVVGRLGWRRFAEGIGVASDPTTPVVAVALGVVAALVLTQMVALVPARRAGRVSAARVLRVE